MGPLLLLSEQLFGQLSVVEGIDLLPVRADAFEVIVKDHLERHINKHLLLIQAAHVRCTSQVTGDDPAPIGQGGDQLVLPAASVWNPQHDLHFLIQQRRDQAFLDPFVTVAVQAELLEAVAWRFAHDLHPGGPEIPARFVFGCRQQTKAMLLEQKNQKDHRQSYHEQQDRQDTIIDSKGDHDGSLYKLVQSMAP